MRAWLVALAVFVFSVPARAHDFAPGVLVFTETAPGKFELKWTAPVDASGAPAGVELKLPEHCVPYGQVRIDCGAEGLHGLLSFEGMHERRMQIVVSVSYLSRDPLEVLVTGDRPSFDFGRPRDSRFFTWLRLGVEHIVGGLDHLAFVLGLLLLIPSLRALLITVTSFTIAHSITLALAAFDVVRLSAAPVEAMIAASVVLVAREAMSPGDSLTRKLPWAVGLGFGLLHGLGFAGALRAIGLPEKNAIWSLFSFNLGVELGQVAILGLGLTVALGFRRLRIAPERPRMVACYGLGAVGAFWLVSRTLTIFTSS
jgi:hydrogenase/urease accessory protein HupE